MTPGMDTSPKFISMTRVFTCPTERTNFQAIIKLIEGFGEKIEGVEVQ